MTPWATLCTVLSASFGGQVVEQHHRGIELREVVLERQDLPAVAQRALRQQPDLGQAVDHDAARLGRARPPRRSAWWFRPARGRRNRAGSAAARIEQAFRRHQLEYLDAIVQRPAVRSRAVAQFALGLRQGDVEALLAGRAPAIRNCSAIVVLPVPGAPSTRNRCPRENPPDRILSRPQMPVFAISAGVGNEHMETPNS